MATTSQSTTTSATTDPREDQLFDKYIDTQFANRNCKNTDYAKEPWRHCKDAPNTYLSIRVQKRAEFLMKLGELNPKKKYRVEHEIERIKQTRKNFSAYSNKKDLMKELAESRQAWKNAVAKEKESDDPLPIARSERRASVMNFIRNRQHDTRRPPQPQAIVEHENEHPGHGENRVELEPLYGFKACAMYFKKTDSSWTGYSSKHKKYIGEFPNQKISMQCILEETEGNPLTEPCGKDTIRYFHFPTNNMCWIEKAIARYYGEDPGDLDDRKPYSKMTRKADKLFAREFWRGQMHGAGGIDRDKDGSSTGHVTNQNHHKNDSVKRGGPVHARHMRSRCSIIPRDPDFATRGKNLALFLPYLHWETSSRRAKMVKVVNEATAPKSESKEEKDRLMNVVGHLVRKEQEKRQPTCKHLLGQYLMTVARVADEMDFEADERLLRENVNKNPPLHIRRTLDQYYFLTLEDTSGRDKDQVVYRGTRAGRSFHTRNTRVVMVDQLWLWILDDNTIITSFTRRWGRNKPDPSGVHKSLRDRLENMPEDIKSIHHLALIIIDQCSRVFFDRTKPLDERPEVMDLFASAIGNIAELTAIAYDSFWRNTEMLTRNMLPAGAETTHHKYLDINPEGILLQEAQDITEELKIMKRIYTEQRKVVKDFKRHLEHPEGKRGDDRGETILIQKLIDALRKSNDKNDGTESGGRPSKELQFHDDTVHEAGVSLELLESRQAEIQDLEDSALHTCQQLEGLLSLKQQQASIVETKAALRRADESIKQGRAIMAFTIVTIFFLPLGFLAAFFGMNNSDINAAMWMTLHDQIYYMFGLSAIIIVLSVSMAFSAWSRAMIKLLFSVPIALVAEYTGFHGWLKTGPLNHVRLERRSAKILEHVSRRRQDRKKEKTKTKDGAPRRLDEPLGADDFDYQGTGLSTIGENAEMGHNISTNEKSVVVTKPSLASEETLSLQRLWNCIPRRRTAISDEVLV